MNTNEIFAHDRKVETFRRFAENKNTYVTNVCKEVIAECVSRLYMSSLIFENASELESQVKPVAFDCFMETMSDCKNIEDIKTKFHNASPYVKGAVALGESIALKHDPVVCVENRAFLLTESENTYTAYRNAAIYTITANSINEAVDAFEKGEGTLEPEKTVKEFSKKDLLDPIDYSTITAWERDSGKDIYDNAMRDRLTKVFNSENDAADKQRERIQKITDTLAQNQLAATTPAEDPGVITDDNGTMQSNDANAAVVESAIGLMKASPRTVFSAILGNKSRAVLRESGSGASIVDYGEDIMKETICTYAIYECIHSLGLHTYTDDEKRKLISEFALGGK